MYEFEYDAQQATVLSLVMQTGDVITEMSKRYLANTGLSPEQYHVLLLCMNFGPITIRDLTRMLARKSQSVSGLLKRMEAKGLLRRDNSGARDRHGPMSIVLTDPGIDAYRRAADALAAPTARCVDRCSDAELDQLEASLRTLRNSLVTEQRSVQAGNHRLRLG